MGLSVILDVNLGWPFQWDWLDAIRARRPNVRVLPIVFRCCMYYGSALAAQHSDRPYPLFMNVPGLKIVCPSTPATPEGDQAGGCQVAAGRSGRTVPALVVVLALVLRRRRRRASRLGTSPA